MLQIQFIFIGEIKRTVFIVLSRTKVRKFSREN